MAAELLIAGLGNWMRSDDGAGIQLASDVTESLEPYIASETIKSVVYCDPSTLPLLWNNLPHVIVLDAVKASAAPGTIIRVNALEEALPEGFASATTHQLGLASAIELSRSLNRLPERLEVIGIVGENFEPGDQLSLPVKKAIHSLAPMLVKTCLDYVNGPKENDSSNV